MHKNFDTAVRKLNELVKKYPELDCKNEAETRFHFIDEFLTECLLWPRDEVHVEKYESGDRTDYELGEPRRAIVEAKRDEIFFEIPARNKRSLICSIANLTSLSREANSAIEQVQKYCSSRGVKYAIICNGNQIIAFVAVRVDGKSPLDGGALVIDGFQHLIDNFSRVYQCLSRDGILTHKLAAYLDANGIVGIPEKLSKRLEGYPSFRYQSDSRNNLRMIAELLLEDVARNEELEARFYRECYCESGALAQDALISKNLLKTRYASLFSSREESPLLAPVKNKGQSISSDVLAESLSRRPIILIGDVGVGKTSFIKNLILTHAANEFKDSIYAYLDVGVNSFLNEDLEGFVADAIGEQLLKKYNIDIHSNDFVRSVYKDGLSKFDSGIYGQCKINNPTLYAQKQLELLDGFISNRERHLQESIKYISKYTRKQVIIIIDNIDQRDLDIQQKAFIISQSIAHHWSAVVFLAVRPNTFHQSKRTGSLSAYPNKVFYIMPPRPEMVLERRIVFALNIAEGRLPVESLSSVSINLDGIAQFFKALLFSIKKNPSVAEFLSNITGGNVRAMIDFVTKFIGSPNVESDKIIDIQKVDGSYLIPLHEFSKAALLGDYSHYEPNSSIAINLFDVRFPDAREHFLMPLILGYLNYDDVHRNGEGFVSTDKIRKEFQSKGFVVEQIDGALRRLTNKKLTETTQRITFEESVGQEFAGDLPDQFRITTVGAYHIMRWCGTFAYIDAMIFDTPIFDDAYRDRCSEGIQLFDIYIRYKRTCSFRDYLNDKWCECDISVPYFNWQSIIKDANETFVSVRDHLRRKKVI